MKMSTVCFKCDENNELDLNSRDFHTHFNYNDGLIKYKCRNGHDNYTYILNNKFELLYDSAIISYYGDNYRECVTNLASCLESFYEYIIRLILYSKNRKSILEIEKFNKKINSRSECREGVFLGMCKVYFDKNFFINDKYKNLRNKVVHNGMFPSKDDAFNFAKYTFDFICNCYKSIRENLTSAEIINFEKALLDYKLKDFVGEYSVHMITTVLSSGFVNTCFEEEIELFKSRAKFHYRINNECSDDLERYFINRCFNESIND